jgi:hypothetical protein
VVDEWDFEDRWLQEADEDYEEFLEEVAAQLADCFFLSDNDFLPNAGEDYSLGHLSVEDWWPLVAQLDETVDLEVIAELSDTLDDLLGLGGVPTELLEEPYAFLESILTGNLPLEPSGRRVSSRKLVKIALAIVRLLEKFPESAQSAVRAWAGVHRDMMMRYALEGLGEEDMADLLFAPDLPPAMTGFSMLIGLTLVRWPDRVEGLPIPSVLSDPDLYDQALADWETLPDHPLAASDGEGEAEGLFAQGQLAHMLAQLGADELMPPDEDDNGETALAYSRLSRAILWVHNRCRHCSERDEVACKVASSWPERPVPLLDVAGEVASTGRIEGCVAAR